MRSIIIFTLSKNIDVYYIHMISGISPSKFEGFTDDIPERYSRILPNAPSKSIEDGRVRDLQTIMFQQNILYSVASISVLSLLVGVIVLGNK